MSKIILALTFVISSVAVAEEVHNFPAPTVTKNYSCAQLNQVLANRGFVCAQSAWFKDWCTMHVLTASQCYGQNANVSYERSADTRYCQLGYVCIPRGNDGQ